MAEEVSLDYSPVFPVSFRVFGIGESCKSIINKIDALGYDGVSATVINIEQLPSPTEEDRMAIFLTPTSSKRIHEIAKSFYDAGVLTLIVTSDDGEWQQDSFDSIIVAQSSQWRNIVKSLLDPIFLYGQICYDFNDLCTTLKGTRRFAIADSTGGGVDRFKNAVANLSSQLDTIISGIERISLIIYFNPDINPPVVMSEIKVLSDYIQTMPEQVELIWAIFHDNRMDCNLIRISAIYSGKNLTI